MANLADANVHLGPAAAAAVFAGFVLLVWMTVSDPAIMLVFSGQRAASSTRERASSSSPPTSTSALPWYLTLLLRLLVERPEGALGPGRHARLLLVPAHAGALARRLLLLAL